MQAMEMLRASNVGKRRRHTVKEVVDFLESLPEQVVADVEFFGADLIRNIYTSGEDLYSVTHIELKRMFRIMIFGWEYYYDEDGGGWEFEHGIIFARNEEKNEEQQRTLDDVFARCVEIPDCSNGGDVSEKQLREALTCYEIEHGDGEPVFYRRSEDGALYLRDGVCSDKDEERYFEDLEPLDLEEAIEQFWKSKWFVYEEYDE